MSTKIMNEEVEEHIRDLFCQMDIDGNGYIEETDLIMHTELGLSKNELDAYRGYIEDGDEDGDGKLSYEEFRTFYIKKNNFVEVEGQ